MLQATPILICWNLWKNRCASKHEGKLSNLRKVWYVIYMDNFRLMTTNFPRIQWPTKSRELINIGEICVHVIKVTMLTWTRSPDQSVKINTDWSALSISGKIGACGVVRLQIRMLLVAFASPLREGTNNEADIKVGIFGTTWALEMETWQSYCK